MQCGLLENLLNLLEEYQTVNFENIEITGLSYNSKTTKAGDIFICIKGEEVDSHNFAQGAIENGSVALFCEKELPFTVPQVIVKDTKRLMANISASFYDEPSKKLNLIGVTGTNGKTTVTHLLQKIVEANNEKCSLIGTLGYKYLLKMNIKKQSIQLPNLQNCKEH